MSSSWMAFWDDIMVPFDDPSSRMFILNLFLALALAVWVVWRNNNEGHFILVLKRVFLRKKYWWNASSRLDLQFYFLNGTLKTFLFVPLLSIGYWVSTKVSYFLLAINGGEFAGVTASPWGILAFTLLVFVWDDFLRFGCHLLMHRVPFLWRFHRVHHSARVLTL